MIRVVFDTNVVVSAVLTRGGAAAHALDLAAVLNLHSLARSNWNLSSQVMTMPFTC